MAAFRRLSFFAAAQGDKDDSGQKRGWQALRRISASYSAETDDEFAAGCLFLRACAKCETELVKKQLNASPNLLHFSDYDGRTALHVAASEGHAALVGVLLERGGNPNRSDRWGGSPLDDAQRHHFPKVASVLRQHGGNAGHNDQGMHLIVAASKGDLEEVRSLIEDGQNVSSADYDLRTPLHLAASEGHDEVVSYLIQSGASVNMEDRWGGTPLDDARRKGHAASARALEEAGAKHSVAQSISFKSGGSEPSGMEVDWADMTVIEKIGSGAFGDIFKCRWRGTLVAAKTIKSAGEDGGLSIRDSEAPSNHTLALEDFRHEINFLASLRHPNICLLLGFSLTDKREVMISELMKCSLLDVMKTFASSGTPFSLERTMRYAIEFAQGMNFLHTNKPPIIHRDLKPANLLLDFTDTLKVADFGLAKLRPERKPGDEADKPYVMTGETGSYRFMAPEVFRHEEYGRPVDVYAFAMILFNMLAGEPPWAELDGVRAAKLSAEENDRPPIPRHIESRLQELLRLSWDPDPHTRPSFAAVLDQLNKSFLERFGTTFEQSLTAKKASASSAACILL